MEPTTVALSVVRSHPCATMASYFQDRLKTYKFNITLYTVRIAVHFIVKQCTYRHLAETNSYVRIGGPYLF